MSTSTPTTSSPSKSTPTSSSMLSDPDKFLHAVAIGGVIACPLLLAMPPRKLDLYTFAIVGLGVFCGNHLVAERNNGIGMMGLAGSRLGFTQHPGPVSPLPSVDHHNTSSLSSTSRSFGGGGGSSSSSTEPNIDALLNPANSHATPGHESALERMSLPTERARGLHEAMAAEREAAAVRRRRYLELRRRAQELAHTGWGLGGDLAGSLQRAARVALEDARRHGWPEPPGAEEVGTSGKVGDGHGEALASAVQTGHAFTREGNEGDGMGRRKGGSESEKGGLTGMAKKVWMGGETEGWQERRLREEQDALDEGRGYSDLIIDQIWEVWNWDKKKDEDGNWVPKNAADKKD